jgi:tRNA G18 (ribose-2'-O)-methylase SpoU
MRRDEVLVTAFRVKGRLCIFMGSEGEGMWRLVRETRDFLARIPAASKGNVPKAS